MSVYAVGPQGDTELAQPGGTLCEACSYALRFKRYRREVEPPGDTPAAYAEHLRQQREDAKAMEAVNAENSRRRGIEAGHEHDGEAAKG
eukprot:11735667-Alexandrium_andersonii.AAC.1